MTVREMMEKLELEAVNLVEPDREVVGGFTGDLLSFVLGNIKRDNVWVTIMTNTNIVAVASQRDIACIIVTESDAIPVETAESAKIHNINILRTKRSSFEMCSLLSSLGI